ncbi:nedd4-binding protein 2-like 2 isoform x1 [Limosa lapponica baueri]|uniref:Nedd4-binding protein 2-like 2 isoform x1 n=1 Tax=Limosa lapponica baueri TaxID=1758121 RepID=A0A2I0UBZ9_LIMLA|nr:nedd4-binding protein 2-like 2 isoform x1 [Limosa lapponica baueri]
MLNMREEVGFSWTMDWNQKPEEMLHAESRVRLLEYQDEISIEPCSKKMKSTEGAYEKLSDDDNQGIQEEAGAERTSNNLIPVYASDNQMQHEMQEKVHTGSLGTADEVLPENNIVLSQAVDSETVHNLNPPFASTSDTKVEEKKGPFITNNAGEDDIRNSCTLFSVNRNASDEEFFTSKEFIGPIYKPVESSKRDKSGSCDECGNSGGDQNELPDNRAKRKEAKKFQTISSAVPQIDDELDQFYKEIHQLENENVDANIQEKETETSQEQYSPYKRSQTSQEDYQGVLLGSPQPFHENGQCFFEEQNSGKPSNEQQFVVETSGWKTENTFMGQADSKYWNYSVPEFRPAWQATESFVVPQGPLAPRFDHQSHFQILNSPPQKPNALPSHNGELPYKNYHGYHGNTDFNSHSPLLDQSTNYASHTDFHTTQVFRNGNNDQNGLQNNDQNGLQNNGFCETREECWKDAKADNTEGMHSFSPLQLPEERFSLSQKWLLILRGLPGSGKSTLSRILLGQSRDGIVFSTDDYFRQQDGYTYNAAQLGDAHDWNQKRAKQAMEQGKSPVIIDNTNTQAWEMKPYVEVALEKGYRVEFHEPDTWWKFDPEELEKRNKHGVTREKIAQMLERYEYQISIPIVMNSVVPPHKNTQRPLLQRRHSMGVIVNGKQAVLDHLMSTLPIVWPYDEETEGINEDYNTPLLSTDKLRSYQITCEPDMEAKLLSLNGEGKETSQYYNSNVHDNVPDNNAEDKAGEVYLDSLVEARATFMPCLSEVNGPRNDAAPITSKRKRHRRIVNLAPKFNLPRQLAGTMEGGKEVPVKDYVPEKSVCEVEGKSFLRKDLGEEREQDPALQEYSALCSGTEATCSLPTLDTNVLLDNISYVHSGQSSPVPKYSCRVCVVSRTKEEQARTLKQRQVVDEKESESEQVSSEVTNSQPDILSSVVSEYPEDSSILASCSESVHEADDPEPAEASQVEDNQDVNMKCSFLGLPLSLGFAFQLVQLFGSPGLPLDDIISLEDLNKNRQDDQDSSETLPEMELFQGLIEENIMTYTSTGCLDAVFHQS